MIAQENLVPCLVKDTTLEYCSHRDCKFFHRHPINYFERRSERIKRRKDFTYFRMHTSYSGSRWIMPINPYQESMPERNSFEMFRQGQAEIQIVGAVPNYRDQFHRDEIAFKYIAQLKNRGMISEDASIEELMSNEEIIEVAFFTGPV